MSVAVPFVAVALGGIVMHRISRLRVSPSTGSVLGALLLVVGLGAAQDAQAQARRSGLFEVGVFGGYHSINEDNELGNAESGKFAPTSAFLGGLRFGSYLSEAIVVEAEVDFEGSSFADTADSVGIFGFRVGARYTFMTDQALRPFVHVAAGSLSLLGEEAGRTVSDTDAHYSFGVGALYDLHTQWAVRADLRYVAVPGNASKFTNDVMALIGVSWTPGAKIPDSDGDGIDDSKDRCPNEAEDKDGFSDVDGCPEPDNDNDGILDGADRCPNEAETRNGYRDDDGCPDADQDSDGIPDAEDKCPDKAEDKDGFQDSDGCPEPDNDRDGVLDGNDKCPNQAEDKDGFQDDDGCPEADNDNDGFGDATDKCPNEPETQNGFDDGDGCPDTVPEKVAKSFSGTMEGIQFETGSTKIKKTSFKVLDKAVAILAEFESVRVEVSGHTDNVGDPGENAKLSQGRADAVKDYIVSKGIAADRVQAKGYGDSKPVGDNATAKGKAENRRIEFQVITTAKR